MQKTLLYVVACVISITVSAQCTTNVNFNTWTVGGQPANGNWVVQGGGTSVHQTVNGDPAFFVSPFDLMNVHVSGTFKTTDGDNDWMGFVFSYLNPLTPIDSFDCWLYDWKQEQQGGASSGMSLDRILGVVPPASYNPQFWDHVNSPEFTVIQNTFGGAGWSQGANNNFDLYLTYTRATIFVNGAQVFDWHDCFKPGRFGFYNYSQKDCYYSNFQYSLYIDFWYQQKVCLGQAAPFNFIDPCVTSLGQYQSLTWNFGDGQTSVINNPTLANVNVTHTYAVAGNYTATLTVVDANGCSATTSHVVDVRNPITLAPTLNQPPCNGGSNGGIVMTPSGGFGNYTYNWSDGTTQSSLVGASAGTYTITVTDGVCNTTGQYTLSQPPPLSATTSHTNASCGLQNGTATIVISGGTPPYQGVNWGPPFPGATATGLGAGTFIADFHDANGCSALLQYSETISSSPCGITSSTSNTNITCFGGNNGTVTLNVAGGTGAQVITWNPGNISGSSGVPVTGLTAGTYTFNYSDANAAHAFSGSVIVTEPSAAMVAQMNTTPIACAGSSTGQAIASVISGGVAPYSYNWNPAQGNNPVASNLPPGNMNVTVTDASGCTATAAGTISGVPSLNVAFTTVIDSCYHSGKGSAIAHITGGTAPYTFTWSNFVTDTANLSLTAGTYTISVNDYNGCSVTASATITGPASSVSRSYTFSHYLCYGSTAGFFNVVTSGGTQPYTYTWNPSSLSGNNPTGLSGGIYMLTISDAYGCTAIAADTIVQPAAPLSVVTSHTDVTCPGANDGTITATLSGSTAPYVFMGDTFLAGTYTIPNLAANTYAGTVIDSIGCTANFSETITEPGPQSLIMSNTNEPCNGSNTATASANFVNATGNVVYNWTGGLTGANITGLTAGTYNVTGTDANNCTQTSSVTVTEPVAPVMTVTAVDALCFGGMGSATANPVGGTAPYNYIWSNGGANNQTITPLAGSYTVSSSDASSCNQTAAFTINEPATVVVQEQHTDVLCFGDATGSITLTVTGGTGAAYTYVWAPNVSSSNAASNIAAGNYSITVADANSCTVLQTSTVNEPTALTVTATATDASCNGVSDGTITATATGGVTPYNYSVNAQNSANGQFSAMAAGSYVVTVTDANSCTNTAPVDVNEPLALTDVIAPVDVSCYHYTDGQIVVTASGGNPGYNYSLSNGSQNSTGSFTGLSVGSYSVTISDANNCTITDNALINEPDSLQITVTPDPVTVKIGQTVQLQTVVNTSSSVTYDWNPQFGLSCYDCPDPSFSGNYSAVYTVTMQTVGGCTGSTTVTVTVIPNYDIFIPNVFTPNGDGANDTWQMFGNMAGIKQIEVMVFNRWGEKVFESTDINFAWDGIYKGESVPGVYSYAAKFVWLNNHSDNSYKGTVTLMK